MPKRNLAWMLVVLVIAMLLWQLPQVIAERDTIIRSFGVLAEIRAEIRRRFVGDVDDARLTSAAVRAAATAMIRELNDPHARYLDPQEHKRFLSRTGGLVGDIGAEVMPVGAGLVVQHVRRDSPAETAGLVRGDKLLAIEGQSVGRLDLIEALGLLTGEPGSELHLLVEDAAREVRPVTVERAALQRPCVRGWRRIADDRWSYLLDARCGAAYIRLSEFLPSATAELDQAVSAAQQEGARAWILDLRENRGGLLEAAVEAADRFLTGGLIVTTRGTKGPTSDRREWRAQLDGTYPDLPLVVLVNGWSASSAEILSGALRDQRRAVLIGERTYGKGSVQELIPLQDGGAIKLTTRYYYLPGGSCIQRTPGADPGRPNWGVEPNVIVAMADESRGAWLARWLTEGLDEPAATRSAGDGGPPDWPAAASEAASGAARAGGSQPAVLDLSTLDWDPQLQRAVELLRTRPSTSVGGPAS